MSGNTPGVHGAHAAKYVRKVQVNKDEEAGKIYKKANPSSVIESVNSSNGTDYVIMFAEECEPGTKYKNDLTGTKQLEVVKLIQNAWVREGSTDDSKIEHNVSNTITVEDGDWDNVRDYIWENRYDFAGISLLSSVGDLVYPQAPYTEVLDPLKLVLTYGHGIIFASGLIVDAENIFGDLWKACDCFQGIGEKVFSDINDADQYIQDNFELDANAEELLDLSYRDVVKFKSKIQDNKLNLLKTLGYGEEFAEELVNKNIPIPMEEVMKYLDETNFNHIHKLSEKREIVNRFKKFSKNYFEKDDQTMLFGLKHVQTWHDWCNIKRHHKDIEWSNIKWNDFKAVEIDTTGSDSCAGGSCEITKI